MRRATANTDTRTAGSTGQVGFCAVAAIISVLVINLPNCEVP